MRFLYKQTQAKKKEVFEVEIDRPAKVKFMTASEFKRYKNARTHSFYGGTFEETPIRFVVPFDSAWCVVIEKGSYRAPVDIVAGVKLLPPDRNYLSSIAVDAPEHLRLQMSVDEDEVNALSQAGRSEG